MEKSLSDALSLLRQKFDFHAAILYGSRVSGPHFPDSDFDFLLIKESGPRQREIFTEEGLSLDLIVSNEADLANTTDFLYLFDSRILRDEKGVAAKLVAEVSAFLSAPPRPMPPERVRQRRKQSLDSLRYIELGSALGHYRRAWLLVNLLPLYFELRQRWYLGDKHGIKWLKTHDPQTNALFEQALAPAAPMAALKDLIDRVFQA